MSHKSTLKIEPNLSNSYDITAKDITFSCEQKNRESNIKGVPENNLDINYSTKKMIVPDNVSWRIIDNRNEVIVDKLKPNSCEKIYLELDFSAFLNWKNEINFTFQELLYQRRDFDCILTKLKRANRCLVDKGLIDIKIKRSVDINLITRFLNCAHFENVEFKGDTVTATKSYFTEYLFNRETMVFKETNDPEEIQSILIFAKDLFSDKNYRIDIDKLFIPNSNFYYCYEKKTHKIIDFMRFTWYLPEYPLPCMLATTENDHHILLNNPSTHIYGEIFSPFINKLSAVKAYKEFVKNILSYCERFSISNAFTTYDKQEPMSGEFFKQKFGFIETGDTLRYGDFDNIWNLLLGTTDQIKISRNNFLNMKE